MSEPKLLQNTLRLPSYCCTDIDADISTATYTPDLYIFSIPPTLTKRQAQPNRATVGSTHSTQPPIYTAAERDLSQLEEFFARHTLRW